MLDMVYHGEFTKVHYQKRSGLILGFHGTDESIVQKVVMHVEPLKPSNNAWDWIGHGIYFWEHSPSRALEFARTSSQRKDSNIKRPAVLGAVIDLGNCLDLLDYNNLSILRDMYNKLSQLQIVLPQNRFGTGKYESDLLFRDLDCHVIEELHDFHRRNHITPFDSVKAVFFEGPLLYPNAGFREKNHIQICIRNPNCIKGLFIPKL